MLNLSPSLCLTEGVRESRYDTVIPRAAATSSWQ